MPTNNIFYMCIHLLLLINAYYKMYIYYGLLNKEKYQKYIFDIFLCNCIKLINLNNANIIIKYHCL